MSISYELSMSGNKNFFMKKWIITFRRQFLVNPRPHQKLQYAIRGGQSKGNFPATGVGGLKRGSYETLGFSYLYPLSSCKFRKLVSMNGVAVINRSLS